MTYLLTFSSYGQRLHGDPRGSVHREQNGYGTPIDRTSQRVVALEQRSLRAPPFSLRLDDRNEVLHAIQEVCAVRNWHLLAAHIRTTHGHLVVTGECAPETMLSTFKAYATRTLNTKDGQNLPRWTTHGSTRYLWTPKSIAAACNYVLFLQGNPLTVFPS